MIGLMVFMVFVKRHHLIAISGLIIAFISFTIYWFNDKEE